MEDYKIDGELSKNGWQNIGICSIYAYREIDSKEGRYFYIGFAILSFGYKKIKTNRLTYKKLCSFFKVSEPTLSRWIKWLVDNNFLKVITYNEFIEGGGSYAYQYSPAFPKGYGKINLDRDDVSNSSVGSVGSKNKESEKEKETLSFFDLEKKMEEENEKRQK